MILNSNQKERYIRNLVLPDIGEEGQIKLLKSKVLVVGAGGLGSPVILYLAAAGVGDIVVVDDDVVELSNLQRQIIHDFKDLGVPKVDSAKQSVMALNEDVKITTYQKRVNKENLGELISDRDFILDCSDNFPTRFVINEVCFKEKKPIIFAAVKGFLGQVSVFKSYENNNPCYACFNPNIVGEGFSLPLKEKGILGSVAGTFGAIQSTNAIKEILGISENLVGKILVCDLLKNEFRKVSIKKNLNCSVCSNM